VLYFFYGENVAVLAHGLTKEAEVTSAEVKRALERKVLYEKDPAGHTYAEDLGDG
jgi:hypothetical protein